MPFAVADSLAARGIAPVLFALKGACDPVRVERFRHHWISVGQLGRATKLFRSEGCRDLIFIGTLLRPALSEIRLDWGTIRVLGRIIAAFRGGDDHLLSGIGRILEQDGFRMVGIKDVAPDHPDARGMHHPRNARSVGHRRHRERAGGAARAQPIRHRPGRRRDRRPCGCGRGHRGHRRVAGARGTAAQRRPHPRQSRAAACWSRRPRAARTCASTCRRSARRTVDGAAEAGLAGIAIIAGNTIAADSQAMIEAADTARPLHPGSARVTPARASAEIGRKIFLIATEESGDRLGANLMKVLRQRLGGAVRFEGVGGRAMAREGLASLFPIEELSIIGLAAVVKQLPKILRLIKRDRSRGDAKPRPTSSSSSTVPISPIAWPSASAPAIPKFRSSIMSRPRSGRGGRAGRGRC